MRVEVDHANWPVNLGHTPQEGKCDRVIATLQRVCVRVRHLEYGIQTYQRQHSRMKISILSNRFADERGGHVPPQKLSIRHFQLAQSNLVVDIHHSYITY
jgi:hypothetical protein